MKGEKRKKGISIQFQTMMNDETTIDHLLTSLISAHSLFLHMMSEWKKWTFKKDDFLIIAF